MSIRVIVTGGRDYVRQHIVNAVLEQAHRDLCGDGDPPTLVHGGARGADTCAAKYARSYYWPVHEFPAHWGKFGAWAGPRRNQQMVDAGADLCLAFPGVRGTEDMVRRAKAAGIPVRRVGGRGE